MTNAKVTVTKEVAEALYGVERNCIGINIALTLHAKNDLTGEYAPLQSLSIEDLAKALINGYQVEKSPEDKVREYYEGINELVEKFSEAYDNGALHSVRHTLDLLGIKVEGVNA